MAGASPDEQVWSEVDRYFDDRIVAAEPALEGSLAANAAAGLPRIDVSATQGKFLRLLARVKGATSILEVGTLGGYSTIWLAGALPPSGRLVTLEIDARHAEVAAANIERAGYSSLVDIRVGPARDSLEALASENGPPFDFVFIDADKVNTPVYFDRAVELSEPGSVIVVDNVVRGGALIEPREDPNALAMQRFVDSLAGDERVDTTALQTVGNKGYDGFVLALVS